LLPQIELDPITASKQDGQKTLSITHKLNSDHDAEFDIG